MNAVFGIQILGMDEVRSKLVGLPMRLAEAERRSVEKVAVRAVASWKRRVSGSVLKVRSGEYRAGIDKTPAVRAGAGDYESRVGVRQGPASAYAAIHETGGTIRAKNRLLAIPLPALLTKAGVSRSSTPRDFPDGFWFTSKAGNAIFAIRGRGEELVPLFVGKPSVTIPARRPMGQTLDEIRPLMAETFEAELRRAAG